MSFHGVFNVHDDEDETEDCRDVSNPFRLHRIMNGRVSFHGVTGAVLAVQQRSADDETRAEDIHGVMEQLHLAHFGGWTIKWLYFLSGMAGTAMVATGVLLFSIKRRKKSEQEFDAATDRVYRAVEALNVTAVVGTALACIAYLYGNRLLPPDMAQRQAWEIRVFFGAWLGSLLHATLQPVQRAWRHQFAFCALLCMGLPLLNAASTGQSFWRYAAQGDWQRAAVELTAMGFGLLCALAWFKVRP